MYNLVSNGDARIATNWPRAAPPARTKTLRAKPFFGMTRFLRTLTDSEKSNGTLRKDLREIPLLKERRLRIEKWGLLRLLLWTLTRTYSLRRNRPILFRLVGRPGPKSKNALLGPLSHFASTYSIMSSALSLASFNQLYSFFILDAPYCPSLFRRLWSFNSSYFTIKSSTLFSS